MKRGLGSPNYNPERAKQVRQMGNRAQRSQNKHPRWTAGPEGTATVAGQKGGDKRWQRQQTDEQQIAA